MNQASEQLVREPGAINCPNVASEANVSGRATNYNVNHRAILAGWLNGVCPNSNLSSDASDEELRTCLYDGNILVHLLSTLKFVNEVGDFAYSRAARLEKLNWFLAAIKKMGLPGFAIPELEKGGSLKSVTDCVFALRERYQQNYGEDNTFTGSPSSTVETPRADSPMFSQFSPLSGEQRQKISPESTFQRSLLSPIASDPSAALVHHGGHKFHEVFQLKQVRYVDLPATKISEMMTSNSLDNAPTQSLLSVVNGILDESVERMTGEIPHRVACLLRKVVQEIERRISTQSEHIRTQNNVFKSREEKYQSRIRILEALAAGSGEESLVEKTKVEEKKKLDGCDMIKLIKEKEEKQQEILALKQELEVIKKTDVLRCIQVETEANELRCIQMETEAKEAKATLEMRLKELECLLTDSRNKVQDLEALSESKSQRWSTKEDNYQSFIDFQSGALQELRFFSESIKQEIMKTQLTYSEEFNGLGVKLKELLDVAEKYKVLLLENRKMLNEIQELKGNIRVYCRIRPFLNGQIDNRTSIEYVGESGELVIANPSKLGKDGNRLFKFNKVFSPVASQVEIFSDIQPLIQSVFDGYNVCIFAYGQTGSGKTYTMMGPNASSKENWGVNYRALNDLFNLSQSRRSSTMFEIGVQIVEIYNEQVRDLLSGQNSHKRLGIMTQSQPYGRAVPDANMVPVNSTSDVIELMDIGLKNRAVGATALNERSSRSHSVVTVHVRGTDMKTAASLHGNLHLVDLAGSERVDRSKVTGDRLREAQHINKSLSALGDVIFALAQKSPHVPYRNSKLTQLLQSSLGGQAKTLMFVQLNPDVNSYSESLSTLKFAERVTGVELGAARSSKEGRDVRELMDQVASLKDTISKKDDEIERLQLLKDFKNVYPSINGEKEGQGLCKHGVSSLKKDTDGETRRSQQIQTNKGIGLDGKVPSDQDSWSEYSDVHSEADSQQSMDDFKHQNEFIRQLKVPRGVVGGKVDENLLRFVDADYEERLVDISNSNLHGRAVSDAPAENLIFSEGTKPSENLDKPKTTSITPRLVQKSGVAKEPSKVTISSSIKIHATSVNGNKYTR